MNYKKGLFKITDKVFPNIVKRSTNESVLFNSYKNGFIKRAEELERCYQLDRVNFKNKDLILDCGANHGDPKLWFDFKNIEISYIGFDPDPEEFNNLKKNVFPYKVYNIFMA